MRGESGITLIFISIIGKKPIYIGNSYCKVGCNSVVSGNQPTPMGISSETRCNINEFRRCNKSKSRIRSKDIILHNSPYVGNIKSRLLNMFVTALENNFPPSSTRRKIFKQHSIKYSYPSTLNVADHIAATNNGKLKNPFTNSLGNHTISSCNLNSSMVSSSNADCDHSNCSFKHPSPIRTCYDFIYDNDEVGHGNSVSNSSTTSVSKCLPDEALSIFSLKIATGIVATILVTIETQ